MKASDRGSVLIITLILMSVAMTLSLYIVKLSKDIIQSYQMVMDKLYAKIEAESTVELLKFALSTGRIDKDKITVNLSLDGKNTVSKVFYINGKEEFIGNTKIKIYDTGRKINLLSIDENVINRVLFNIGLDKKVVPVASDSYLDWIDRDDFKRLNGAEKYYYIFEKKAAYEPRNSVSIQDIEELRLIRGFENYYSRLKDYFFVYPKGSANIYAVDKKVLMALLGITEEQANQILSIREKEQKFKGLEGTLQGYIPALSEYISSFPNSIYEIYIETSRGEAKEKVYSIIDFRSSEDKPFVVVKYVQ